MFVLLSAIRPPSICATRDRFRRAGHALGLFHSAPLEEATAAPQLNRRVPSHFNNQQLRALLQRETDDASESSPPPLYPLSKLLVMIAVRDLQRFISSHAHRGLDEASVLATKEKSASPPVAVAATAAGMDSTSAASSARSAAAASSSAVATAAAASSAPTSSPPSATAAAAAHLSQQTPPEAFVPLPSLLASSEDLSSLSLEAMLARLLWRVCRVRLPTPPEEHAALYAHILREGIALAAMSLQLDKDSRALLNEELYVLPPSCSTAAATPAAAAPVTAASAAASAESLPDNLKHSAAVSASCAAFHARQARSWFGAGKSPFADFRFSKPPALLRAAKRVPCPRCQRPASLYCAFCLVPTLSPELTIPPLSLPVQVDIIHHVGENVKKSTSIHACILAPDHARFLEHPAELPAEGYDPATTLLLYPTADAVHLDDVRCIDARAVRRVLVIESTWGKSDAVASHPALAHLRRVKIRSRESTFWRYQELGRHFLATLEAIYWLCKEIEQRRREADRAEGRADDEASASEAASSSSRIDDLMYLYAFQHGVITERYKTDANVPRSWSGGANTKGEARASSASPSPSPDASE
jgi:hypothetical protein